MPAIKCDNGKWKWGTQGECIYNSREECEEANKGKKSIKKQKDIQYFHAEFKSIPVEKAISEETRKSEIGTIITGYASTPTLDRYNDVVDPVAFSDSIVNSYKKNPIVLFQHDQYRPIGKATYMAIDSKGLYIEAVIVDDVIEPKIKAGILRAFSIGYIPKEVEYRNEKGELLDEEEDIFEILFGNTKRTIKQLDLVENSVVSIPANPDALFTMEKSLNHFFEENINQRFFKETENDIIFIGLKAADGNPMRFPKDQWTFESVKKHLMEIYKNNSITKKEMDNLLKKEDETVTPAPEPEKVEAPEVPETPSGEKPAEVEGSEKPTEGEKVEETTPVNEEVTEEPKEEKPEEPAPVEEDKEFIRADIAVEAVKKLESELEIVKKKNVELEGRLAKLPAKQGLIYSEQKKLPSKEEPKSENPTDEKDGFKSAMVGAAN
jgi:HK97 family phage prohead protease